MTRILTTILSTVFALMAPGCQRSIYTVPPAHTAFVSDPGRLYVRGNVGLNGQGGELAYGIDSAWHLTTALHWVSFALTDSNYLSSTYLDLSAARKGRLDSAVFLSTMLTAGYGWTRCPPGLGGGFSTLPGSGFGVDSGAYARLSLQPAISFVWGDAIVPDSSGQRGGLYTISVVLRATGVQAFDLRDRGVAVSDGQVLLLEPAGTVSWGINRYGFVVEIGSSIAVGDTRLREWPGYLLVGFYGRF